MTKKTMTAKSRPAWRSAEEGRPGRGLCAQEWFAAALYMMSLLRGFSTPDDLARASGVGADRLRDFVAAEAEPTQAELVKLRAALNVSLDFLVAGRGIPVAYEPTPPAAMLWGCKIGVDRIDAIEKGEAEPTLDEMIALTHAFQSPVDYFVAGVRETAAAAG